MFVVEFNSVSAMPEVREVERRFMKNTWVVCAAGQHAFDPILQLELISLASQHPSIHAKVIMPEVRGGDSACEVR